MLYRPDDREDDWDPYHTGFEWPGVTVRHWVVRSRLDVNKHKKPLFRCVSRCGVPAVFEPADLAIGATSTCDACRQGVSHPMAVNKVPDTEWAEIASAWETVCVEIRNNLAAPGVADWNAHGLPILHEFIDRTGLGRNYGWKVCVRDCHDLAQVKRHEIYGVTKWRDSQRQVELKIFGRRYRFDVDISVGRTDDPWPKIRQHLERADAHRGRDVTAWSSPEPEAAPPPPMDVIAAAVGTAPEPPPAAMAADILANSTSRLMNLRAGIDAALEMSRSLQAGGQLRAELANTLASLKEAAAPLVAKRDAAARRFADVRLELQRAQDDVARLNDELNRRMSERDVLGDNARVAGAEAEAAGAELAPVAAEIMKVEGQLEEAERMEAEQLRALPAGFDMKALFGLLEQLGRPHGG